MSLAFTSAALATTVPSTHSGKAAHAAAAGHPRHTARRPSAPADEYFGRQKMSILGVRNTVHDLKIRYDGTVQRSAMVMSVGGGVEDAMHAWAKRYPGDMWLAHNMFQLDEIYMRVPTPEGHVRSQQLSAWIMHDYPKTFYSNYLTHIQAVAMARAQATPAPKPTEAPPSPSAAPSAAASASPDHPQATASASPAASMPPASTALPGQAQKM